MWGRHEIQVDAAITIYLCFYRNKVFSWALGNKICYKILCHLQPIKKTKLPVYPARKTDSVDHPLQRKLKLYKYLCNRII